MKNYDDNYTGNVYIPKTKFLYTVNHRTMEGNCPYDHGPIVMQVGGWWMDKYMVTNARYAIFLHETGYSPSDGENFLLHWVDGKCPEKLLHHPVVWISHKDANAYANWYGARLPLDFEWQYAAAGHQYLKWPWGDRFDREKCVSDRGETVPVDYFSGAGSTFGCEGMCGNIWEMMGDIVDDGMHRFTFLRGGCYYSATSIWHMDGGPRPNDYHQKLVLLNEAINRSATVGFRCIQQEVSE